MNLVSYVSQQSGSPWLDAFGISHNNSCLSGVWYLTTEYAILSPNYTHAFSHGLSQWVILIVVTLLKTTTRL